MDTGKMQQISALLSQGMSSGEVIAEGFAPPTVYKVQRRLRRNGHGGTSLVFPGSTQRPELTKGAMVQTELETENIRLRQEVETLEDNLEGLVDADAGAAAEVQSLRERVKALETEAAVADQVRQLFHELEGQLRQRIEGLEGQLRQATTAQASMSQNRDEWRTKALVEGGARQSAEARTLAVGQDNQQLHGELEQWRQWGPNAQSTIELLTAEVEGLRPLRVWEEHPCKVCKRPMGGGVSRESAAKAMQDFGHPECLKKDSGSSLGWLVAGAAGLAALSQLNKRPGM